MFTEVREWNGEAEFDADADPDSEGTEPGRDSPLNDFGDWADTITDSSHYPESLPVVRPPGLNTPF